MWFVPFSLRDFVDVLLVALLMLWLYRSTRGTNAPIVLMGVVATSVLWVLVRALNMELLSIVFGHIVSIGVVAMLILFQPELRRIVQNSVPRNGYLGAISRIFGGGRDVKSRGILPIIEATATMSRNNRGGIIVLAQLSDLSLITEGGIEIDAKLSTQMLRTIFAENSPLCEGAVVISSGRIVAAKCILPVTQSDVPISMGMRNRAAIGLSEISDAIIIVVSQHTGQISIARAGHLIKDLSADDLASELLNCFEQGATSSNDEVAR